MTAFGRKQPLTDIRFWPVVALHDRQQTAKVLIRSRFLGYLLVVRNEPFDFFQRSVHAFKSYSLNYLGPWCGDSPTGLMHRCREAWDTPLANLNDLMVATFLNQNIAAMPMLIEAKRRIKEQERDGSEYFEGQLLEAMKRVQSGE